MILALLIALLTLCGSSCTKTVYLEKEKIVEVKKYITHTDTLFVPKVEREEVSEKKEITDTSRLETAHAKSVAFVAEGKLHHSLWNKPETFKFDIQIPTLHNDSIVRIREPYPVEVVKKVKHTPTIYKVCLWLIIGEVIFAAIALILKFKRII